MREARPRTSLEQFWEDRLAAEGLPAEIRPLTRTSAADPAHADALVFVGQPANAPADWAEHVSLTTLGPDEQGAALRLEDTAVARHWRAFSSAIWSLPRSWPKRHVAFLHAFGEHGCLLRAARETKITRKAARVALARFSTWRTDRAKC